MLQRDPPTGKLGVLRAVDGLLPVKRHGEGRALGGDLIDVPFSACFRHRIDLGQVDDRAGAVARLGPRVPDIHFVGGFAADFFGIGAADEDAASLIGRLGSSTFRLSTTAVLMSLTGSRFSSESAPGPFHYGIRGRGGTICWAALPSV